MRALELTDGGPERMRRHAPVADYDAYLERWIDQPVYRRMLRHARDEFLAHYPDLETWFAAPLLERVGRERPMASAPRARRLATRRAPTCTTSD